MQVVKVVKPGRGAAGGEHGVVLEVARSCRAAAALAVRLARASERRERRKAVCLVLACAAKQRLQVQQLARVDLQRKKLEAFHLHRRLHRRRAVRRTPSRVVIDRARATIPRGGGQAAHLRAAICTCTADGEAPVAVLAAIARAGSCWRAAAGAAVTWRGR